MDLSVKECSFWNICNTLHVFRLVFFSVEHELEIARPTAQQNPCIINEKTVPSSEIPCIKTMFFFCTLTAVQRLTDMEVIKK